jgi:O-antigen/teichoic acid export membrane protein
MNFYYLISVIGSRVSNLLTVVLLSYLLSGDDFGRYTIVVTNALLLHLVASSWITNSLWRDASIALDGDASSVIARSVKYGLITVAPMLAFVPLALLWLKPEGRYLIFVLLLAPLVLFVEMAAVGLNARRAHREYSVLNFLRGAISLLIGIILVLLGQGLIGALLGQVLGIMLALAALRGVRAMPRGGLFVGLNWHEISPQIRFGLISTLALNLYMLANALSRNVVAIDLGEAEAGYFSIAADMFYAPIALFATSLSLSSIPNLYSAHGNKGDLDFTKDGQQRSSWFVTANLAVAIPYALGGVLTAPAVARLILGSTMAQHVAPIAGYAAVQGASFAFLSTLTTLALTQGRINTALVMSFAALGAFALALVYASHQNSLIAYAQATTAAILLVSVGGLFCCRDAFAVELPLIELGKIVIASVILFGVVCFSLALIPNSFSLYISVFLGSCAFLGSASLLRSNIVRSLLRINNN